MQTFYNAVHEGYLLEKQVGSPVELKAGLKVSAQMQSAGHEIDTPCFKDPQAMMLRHSSKLSSFMRNTNASSQNINATSFADQNYRTATFPCETTLEVKDST